MFSAKCSECKIEKRDGHGKLRNGHGKIFCQVCGNPVENAANLHSVCSISLIPYLLTWCLWWHSSASACLGRCGTVPLFSTCIAFAWTYLSFRLTELAGSPLLRKNGKKNPRQGKHREFGNFAKTQGILCANTFPDSKDQDMTLFAAKFLIFSYELNVSAKSEIVTGKICRRRGGKLGKQGI